MWPMGLLLRDILGVLKNTNTSMMYFETERLPLYSIRIFRMFKFWFKIMQSEICILRASYMNAYIASVKTLRNTVVVWCLLLGNNYIVWHLVTYGMIILV